MNTYSPGGAEEFFKAGEAAHEKEDYVTAASFYRKAAELGHAESMSYLAYAFRFGEGVEEDKNLALYWYQKAYQSGRRRDAGNIGCLYHFKEADCADQNRITALLREGADYGNTNSYVPLAERYYLSKYGHENVKLAAYWAYRAYTAGQLYGSYYMGIFYYNGTFFPKAPAYAKYYLENFVSLGGDEEYANEALSDDELANVNAVKPVLKPFEDNLPNDFFDRENPEELFERGVEMINGYDDDNDPVPLDIDRGIALIRNAAEQGYAKAQTVLGQCFEETDKPCPVFFDDGSLDIYESDGKQAVYWLTKAADKGEISAIDTLIPMFAKGVGGATKNRILVDMYSDMRLKLTGEPFEFEEEEEDGEAENGYRVLHFTNGSMYEGNIANGKLHGQGKYTTADGFVYEGNFFFGEAEGKGKITYPDGNVYVGNVNGFKPDGYGTLKKADGSLIRGMWKQGNKQGLCSYYFANGCVYHGGFDNDDYSGLGVYIFENGVIRVGKFKSAECLTYNEVMRYQNSFKSRQSGRTRYYGQLEPAYINGQTVDCPNGYGERYTDGVYEVGIFKNSHLVHGAYFTGSMAAYGDFDQDGNIIGEGEVLFIDDSGLIGYKGGFLRNCYGGRGIYTYSNGYSYLATWHDGLPTGDFAEKCWAANGDEILRLRRIDTLPVLGPVRND